MRALGRWRRRGAASAAASASASASAFGPARFAVPARLAAPLTLLALAGAGGVWALASMYAWPVVGDCWFRAVTGWPCAGCGMGRAFRALALGQWRAAVGWHPLAVPFAGALLLSVGWLGADAVGRRATFYPALHRATAGGWGRALLLLAVAAAWGWNLWRNDL